MSLKDFWYIASPSDRLRDKPLATTLFAQPLVLFRGPDGLPRALLDRCSHRGAKLSEGKLDDGCVTCPYHGWKWRGDGTCAHVPSVADGRPVPSGLGVKHLPAVEQEGFVWVWCGESAPIGLPRPFPRVNDAGWTTFRMETKFAGGVEPCLENFLDCPHTAHVHRGWFRTPDTRPIKALVRRDLDGAAVEFANEELTPSLVTRLIFPKGRSLRHTDRFLMPSTTRVDYDFGPDRHFIITSHCSPGSDMETIVHTLVTYNFGVWGPLMRLWFEPMSRRIIKQDVDILGQIAGNARQHPDAPPHQHVETDLLGLHIAALRRRADRSLPPEPAEEKPREIILCF